MDDVTLRNIRTRFAALPDGAVVDGHWWDVRDHGMALLAEIDRLRGEAGQVAAVNRRVEVLREAVSMQAEGRQVTAAWLAERWDAG